MKQKKIFSKTLLSIFFILFIAATVQASDGDIITLTAPNGGEHWYAGDRKVVSWSYQGNPGNKVKIEWINADDSTVALIKNNVLIGKVGSGSYKLKIPAGFQPGNYKIRVTSIGPNSASDISDDSFSIQYLLTIKLAGNGKGKVARGQGEPCSANCETAYSASTPVTLTADPELGSTFRGWSGACKKYKKQLTCSVELNKTTSATAIFSELTGFQAAKGLISDLRNVVLSLYDYKGVGTPGILETPFNNVSNEINTKIAPTVTQVAEKAKWIIESASKADGATLSTFTSPDFPGYILTLTKTENENNFEFIFTIKDSQDNTIDSGSILVIKDVNENVKTGSIDIHMQTDTGDLIVKLDFTTTISEGRVTTVTGTGYISGPDFLLDFSQDSRKLYAKFGKTPDSDSDLDLYPTSILISGETTSSLLKMDGELNASSIWADKGGADCYWDWKKQKDICNCSGEIRPKTIAFEGSIQELKDGSPTGLKYNGSATANWTNAGIFNGCSNESATNYPVWNSSFSGTLEAPSYYKLTSAIGISQIAYNKFSLTANYKWTKSNGSIVSLSGKVNYNDTKKVWSGTFTNQNNCTLSFTYDDNKARDEKLSGSLKTSSGVKVADIYTLYGLPMIKYNNGYFESLF